MSKLLENPKIAELVEKEVAKAVKVERTRCFKEVKNFIRYISEASKSAVSEIKSPANTDFAE